MKRIQLTKDFFLFGFTTKALMKKWIHEFNSMDGFPTPDYFYSLSAYSGQTNTCEPKKEWVELSFEPHWYKPYDNNKYCYVHHRWSFESALRELNNPKYIIVIKNFINHADKNLS